MQPEAFYLPMANGSRGQRFSLFHPAVGAPFAELWAEIWDDFRPIVAATLAGTSQHFIDLPVALAGCLGSPTRYFTFSYTALRDDNGAAVGIYFAATETTERVLAERQQRFRLDLADRLAGVTDPTNAMGLALEVLGQYLSAVRIGYCEVQEGGQLVDFCACYVDRVAPIAGTYDRDGFGADRLDHGRKRADGIFQSAIQPLHRGTVQLDGPSGGSGRLHSPL